MPIDLQSSVVYGPIRSRRFGNSLGINILPVTHKFCDFDCVYCQYGWTLPGKNGERLKRAPELLQILEEELAAVKESGERIDCLTLAGNGEPTLHPDFLEVVRGLRQVRDRFFPGVPIGILSDASMIQRPKVREALMELDERYMKLDVGDPEAFKEINRPLWNVDWDAMLQALRDLPDKVLQSLFVAGSFDNTTPERVERWIQVVAYVRPKAVQVYTVDRPTADLGIRKVSRERLEEIADLTRATTSIETYVYE